MLCFLLFRGRVLIWYSKSYAPADSCARDVDSMQRFLLFRGRVCVCDSKSYAPAHATLRGGSVRSRGGIYTLRFLLSRGRVSIWYSKSYAPADGHARDVNSMQRFLLFRARVGRNFNSAQPCVCICDSKSYALADSCARDVNSTQLFLLFRGRVCICDSKSYAPAHANLRGGFVRSRGGIYMLRFLLSRGRVSIWYSKSYAPADGHAREVDSMQRFLIFRDFVGIRFFDFRVLFCDSDSYAFYDHGYRWLSGVMFCTIWRT